MSPPDVGMRVRFIADFDYKPTAQMTIAYRAGDVRLVKRECGERAIALGRAELTDFPTPPAGLAQTIAAGRKRRRRAKE